MCVYTCVYMCVCVCSCLVCSLLLLNTGHTVGEQQYLNSEAREGLRKKEKKKKKIQKPGLTRVLFLL